MLPLGQEIVNQMQNNTQAKWATVGWPDRYQEAYSNAKSNINGFRFKTFSINGTNPPVYGISYEGVVINVGGNDLLIIEDHFLSPLDVVLHP